MACDRVIDAYLNTMAGPRRGPAIAFGISVGDAIASQKKQILKAIRPDQWEIYFGGNFLDAQTSVGPASGPGRRVCAIVAIMLISIRRLGHRVCLLDGNI